MLDMYGNNFYFVPFSCLTFSMLLIMDHNPLVSLSEKGWQFRNSGGCLPGVQSRLSACKYRPAKQLRERGSKLSVFVWVYYYGIIFL